MQVNLDKSEDTLHAVLGTVITPCTPIVHRLCNQTIHVSLAVVWCQPIAIREQTVLELTDQRIASLEAR